MNYFFEHYIFLNLEDYFGEGWDIQPMLWALFIVVGLCIATFCLHALKNAMYIAVKGAVRHKAQSPESAKTVEQLGLGSRRFIRFLLRRGEGQLFRALTILGDERPSYDAYMQQEQARRAKIRELRAQLRRAKADALTPEAKAQLKAQLKQQRYPRSNKPDLSTARFYISEDTRAYADRLLSAGDEPIWQPILASAALIVLYIVVALLLPVLLPLFA